MFAWIARTVFQSVIGHMFMYVLAGGFCFYAGVQWATRIDVAKVERIGHKLTELREERNQIEKQFFLRAQVLSEELNAYKKDDKLHRREIDTLKRIRDRGCILNDEELQAHPVSRDLRDGFLGRVRPQND